jgi:putative transposase
VRREPHSLRLRQQVFAAKRKRQHEVGEGENPIEAFLALRRKEARKRRRAASDLAQVQQERATAKPSQVPEVTMPSTPALVTGPVKGKQLRIRRGYAR